MGSGKVGVNTGIIINTRYSKKEKTRPCDCNKCKYIKVVDGTSYCLINGNLNPHRRNCKYYSGPVVKKAKNNKKG